jgi:hypothetical protein
MQELSKLVKENPFLLDTVKVLVLKQILGEAVVGHQFGTVQLLNGAFDRFFLDILGIKESEI